MTRGCDRVAGQLWTFHQRDLPIVLRVLDAIEGTNQPGEKDEYHREMTVAYLATGAAVDASVYVYARLDELDGLDPIEPTLESNQNVYSIWPRNSKWEI